MWYFVTAALEHQYNKWIIKLGINKIKIRPWKNLFLCDLRKLEQVVNEIPRILER